METSSPPPLFENNTPMPFASIILTAASLAVLILGFQAWRLTTSRSVIFNTLLCSTGLLFAGCFAASGQNLQLSYVIPFLAAMAFGGRAAALGWRSRRETELKSPAALMFVVALVALTAALPAFFSA